MRTSFVSVALLCVALTGCATFTSADRQAQMRQRCAEQMAAGQPGTAMPMGSMEMGNAGAMGPQAMPGMQGMEAMTMHDRAEMMKMCERAAAQEKGAAPLHDHGRFHKNQ